MRVEDFKSFQEKKTYRENIDFLSKKSGPKNLSGIILWLLTAQKIDFKPKRVIKFFL